MRSLHTTMAFEAFAGEAPVAPAFVTLGAIAVPFAAANFVCVTSFSFIGGTAVALPVPPVALVIAMTSTVVLLITIIVHSSNVPVNCVSVGIQTFLASPILAASI